MTTRYTQDEWLAIIDQAQKRVPSTRVQYKAPNIGTKEFAKTIDHTLLKLDATKEQIDMLCEEARKHDFKVHLPHTFGYSLFDFFFSLSEPNQKSLVVLEIRLLPKAGDSFSSMINFMGPIYTDVTMIVTKSIFL